MSAPGERERWPVLYRWIRDVASAFPPIAVNFLVLPLAA
jgi:hypothetical protein